MARTSSPGGTPARLSRAWVYVLSLLVLPTIAFVVGTTGFESSNCGAANGDGECDLAALAGLSRAVVALGAGVLTVVVFEVVRAAPRIGR